MGNFNKCIPFTRSEEGGFANVPGDNGGYTYAGLSQINNPAFPYWDKIHAACNGQKRGFIIKDAELDAAINKYYKCNYWDYIKLDEILFDNVCLMWFDWHVMSGMSATKHVQSEFGLKTDGIVGSKTIEAINAIPPDELFTRLRAARIAHLTSIAEHNQQDRQFLSGWLARVSRCHL